MMDNENYRAVSSMARNSEDKQRIQMLTDFLSRYRGASTIPDPYYGSEKAFEYALDLIEDACENLYLSLT